MSESNSKNSALVIVDVQNDFCPGGALAVSEGDSVITVINSACSQFELIIATQDWHPLNHISFASSHPGKQVYDTIPWNSDTQILWPDHCVAGSVGAEFHPELKTDFCSMILRKGTSTDMDSYSAFFENDHITPTGLTGYLRARGITSVVLCGLATDYCIYFSAIDAVTMSFSVSILKKGIRGVNIPDGNVENAITDMKRHGIQFT